MFPILLFGALYALGGMSWLVWGGFVRTIFVLHTTWLVNSATHVWGYRSHETRDDSTNNWWVALLTYGEGWHNNHHAFQTSARHGLRWWEVDMTYVAIRMLSAIGLAHSVKLPKLTRETPLPSGGELADAKSCSACLRSVMSRKMRTTPTTFPRSSLMGAAQSSMGRSLPSLAMSKACSPSSTVSPRWMTFRTGCWNGLPVVSLTM